MDRDILKDILFKEVETIQDIIKRMASNSFLIKGWTVTLVVGVFLLKVEYYQMLIAFIPLIAFWYLDAYFLRQERLYRELYKWVINNRLNSQEKILDMNAYRFDKQVISIGKIMFSLTLIWFYLPITIIICIYVVTNVVLRISGGC